MCIRDSVEIAHRLAARKPLVSITDVRGTAFMVHSGHEPQGFTQIDSTEVDQPGRIDDRLNPYVATDETCDKPASAGEAGVATIALPTSRRLALPPREATVIRLPAYEQVKSDPVLYAHANRVLHLETNPGNARALVQRHGTRDVWINPPPIPLSTAEMDHVFDLELSLIHISSLRPMRPTLGRSKSTGHLLRSSCSSASKTWCIPTRMRCRRHRHGSSSRSCGRVPAACGPTWRW